MKKERAAARAAYARLTHDQKMAYVLGDVDLSDILTDELTLTEQGMLTEMIDQWGERQELCA